MLSSFLPPDAEENLMRPVSCWIAMLFLLAMTQYASAAGSADEAFELAWSATSKMTTSGDSHLNEAIAHDPFSPMRTSTWGGLF